MGFAILADENVERQATRYLEKRGHDVVMVVDALGPGADDGTVVEHAREDDRVVLTSDADFLSLDLPTLYVPNDELDAFFLAEAVDTVADHMQQEQLPANSYITRAWL
ncbi:MAG: DUF5615 family PIN-like protein [Halorientalis sp.]